MKEILMLRPPVPFLATLLAAVLLTLLVVFTVAFFVIPYAIGVHPGEARITNVPIGAYHPT
jgi:hypothetical protein